MDNFGEKFIKNENNPHNEPPAQSRTRETAMGRAKLIIPLLIIVVLIIIASNAGRQEAPERQLPPTEPTAPQPGTGTSPLPQATVSPAPVETVAMISGVDLLTAGFSNNALVYAASETVRGDGGANHTQLTVGVLDLATGRIAASAVVEEIPLGPQGIAGEACEFRGLVSEKTGGSRIRILGYDGRYAYFARECPPRHPYPGTLYALDVVEGRLIETNITVQGAMAFRNGVAYLLGPPALAVDLNSGRVLWNHSYEFTYVFNESNRLFTGNPLGAWFYKNGLVAVLFDFDTSPDLTRDLFVYCIYKTGEEGVEIRCFERVHERDHQDLKQHAVARFTENGRLYVLLAHSAHPGQPGGGHAYLDIFDLSQGIEKVASLELARGELFFRERGPRLYADNGGATIVYTLEPRIVTLTRGPQTFRAEASPLAAVRITPQGSVAWSTQLVDYTDLHAEGDRLYLRRGKILYLSQAGGEPQPLVEAPLGQRVSPGAVAIALPLLFPLLPFLEQPGFTLYYFWQGDLYLLTAYPGESQVMRVELG